MNSAAPGRFITLEGGEGAGKSTQASLLAGALTQAGLAVLLTREPGGAPGAEVLRRLLLSGAHHWGTAAEILLHFAARAEHLEKTVRPALRAGMWVVCDRFFDSTMAYQGWALDGDRALIAALSASVGLTPDLTIVLEVSVATTLARLSGRGGDADRYERLGAGFFARVAEGFAAIAAGAPGRCAVVAAENDVAAVHRDVLAAVQTRLGVPA